MDIEKTKQQATKETKVVNTSRHKVATGSYIVLAVACFAAYLLLRLQLLGTLWGYKEITGKVMLAAGIGFVILTLAGLAETLVAKKSHAKAMRYNLVRLIRLLAVLVIIMVFISFLFQNWYTAAVSLGLISLILGFALQTPISSFIGWLYIIFRSPYHVGDRIQIDTFKGDVVEIGYLDTTLWEFGGDYLTNDVPSGRLIRLPNSLVLQAAVYNYSWAKFPYIWNEIPFYVSYTSDLAFVENTLKEVAKEELGTEMVQHIKELKELVKLTPVDELEIKDFPFVSLRTNANTWLEATLVYLVHPKQAADIRSKILRRAVEALLKQPEKVLFPKGDNR